MAGELQFAAFLSYSRKDVRLARWLVRSLEEFRPPRQTMSDLEAHGARFLAARPVFRDEHDMPVGGVISDRLSEVLDASATMIVLCTSASAKSGWVSREIELFASRHPDRRIIPAVVEGEPDSDASYPPALLKLGKPLAADLRDPAGRRQAVVKIAAAVLGLDVDQLVGRVQKHRAEQRRLVAAVAGAAAAVVVGLGVTTSVMASNARQANDRAYAQVEQLLTKTRADMDDLAAKKALHEAAKLYFDSKAGSRLNDRDLLLKAEWLRQEGEDAGKRGEDSQALAFREEAYAATSELLKRDPDDPEFLFSHTQSAFWVGDFHLRQGEVEKTRTAWETYRSAAEHLYEVAPDYPGAALEVHYANVNLGVLALEEQHDPREAAKAFAAALAALGALNLDADSLNAQLNVSRSHQQYVDALAQFAPASDVMAAVRSWQPLLHELEAGRRGNGDIDFHLANSWGMIFELEEHLPPGSQLAASPGPPEQVRQPQSKRDEDDLVSLSLAAEVSLKDDLPDCRSLPPPAEIDATSKPQLALVRECLSDRPRIEQQTRCAAFAEALSGQKRFLDLEPSWASLLSACSHSAAKAGSADLSKHLDDIARERFFGREPEDMRLRTQFALAGFATRVPDDWINNLNASLDGRGWTLEGGR